ncbi:MAG: aconitase X catalytic domain-containing protein [Methanoregula sp.]|uniref:aconitase X catalytic domain-containing protein n=1 Tax=Methanoregula sp. TaxID=2052170 RepID=UPI0025F37367|nr:aconitase X catalytic domain-containing protein [Methanoregula sp.]MCK9632829.1 aconitase X catalytic domain-containing protein [Methanoregula sp.]
MLLDKDDERILAGEQGETKQKVLELLVALGKVFGAERLVPIASAQVSGASYKTIGEYGLQWLNSLDAKAVVPAVLNPIGMPRDRWQEMGVDPDFAVKQQAVVAAYERLGISLECTCTPYYLRETKFGDHLAWSESSAVCYANSVIGARTNREGGPGALAAALVGKTPCYGFHLDANRRPQVVVRVQADTRDWTIADYGALGYHAGKLVGNRIPFFTGIDPGKDQLKGLGAAMAATGAVALYHVEGVTPEARAGPFDLAGLETIAVESDEIKKLFREIPVDAVAVGCPHCSPAELDEIALLLKGKVVTKPFYVFASQGVIEKNQRTVDTIEKSGARVFADTCMVVSPVMEQYEAIMVNSGKALAYVPDMCAAVARIGTIGDCVRVGTE